MTGGTGMVGGLVLENCLVSNEVKEIVSFSRRPCGQEHEKLKELLVSDFENYTDQLQHFKDVNIAFFCMGVYTSSVTKDVFKKVTLDYALSFAGTLSKHSPNARLCFLSGAGADRTEKSRMAFAKLKGMAENQIAGMKLGGFHSFRPGYIYPVEPRKEPGFAYRISRILYPLIRLLGPKYSITSKELARAMFEAGIKGADKEVLENLDIKSLVSGN